MTIAYDLDAKEGYDLVTARGEVDGLHDLSKYVHAVFHDVVKYGIERILLDNRGVTGSLELAESSDLFFDIEDKADQIRGSRWAVVTASERVEFLKLFENIARNRGFMVLAFESVDDARAWLTV